MAVSLAVLISTEIRYVIHRITGSLLPPKEAGVL